MKPENGEHFSTWYRVLDANGKLWCETRNQQEARESMRPDSGDRLLMLHTYLVRGEWETIAANTI